MAIRMCDFELVDKGQRVVAYPVGIEGVTEGYDFEDAVRMAADWLRETALDFLMREEEWPALPLGTSPTHGGRMVILAVDASLEQEPSVTAAEAARMLGVSTARIAQLCASGVLDSWKVGGSRMVRLACVKERADAQVTPGRPKKEPAAVM